MPRSKVKARPNRPASAREAAAYAHCGVRTIYNWIAEGRLQAWRLGPQMLRVDLDDVDALYRPVPAAPAPEPQAMP